MPTYEYECSACGATFERFQAVTEKPVRRCPECHKARARRLISSGATIIFRGSGFYQTDYRSEEYKAKAKADSPSKSTEGTKDKPADAAPAKKGSAKDAAKAGK